MRTLILLLLLANMGAFYYWQYHAPPKQAADPMQILSLSENTARLALLDEPFVEPPMMMASRENDPPPSTSDISSASDNKLETEESAEEPSTSTLSMADVSPEDQFDPDKSSRFFTKLASLSVKADNAMQPWQPKALPDADATEVAPPLTIAEAADPVPSEAPEPEQPAPEVILSAASLSQPVIAEIESPTEEKADTTLSAPDIEIGTTSSAAATAELVKPVEFDASPVIEVVSIDAITAVEPTATVEIVPIPVSTEVTEVDALASTDETESVSNGSSPNKTASSATNLNIQPTPTSSIKEATTAVCYRTGIYTNKSSARQAARWFENRGALTHLAGNGRRKKTATWVYLPPFASRAAAQLADNVLAQRGIQDRLIVTSGARNNAISLGLYRNEQGLQRRLAELSAKGYYNVKTEQRYQQTEKFQVELKIAGNKTALINEFKKTFKVVLPRKVECKEIAIRKEIP